MRHWKDIYEECLKPLKKEHVKRLKHNDQAYITGQHAIREANRIFGMGNWGTRILNESPRTVDCGNKKILERDVEVWVDAVDSNGVERRALFQDTGVCVVASDKAESWDTASKGCVTDAVKRALRHFGSPFALDLYDGADAVLDDACKTIIGDTSGGTLPKAPGREVFKTVIDVFRMAKTAEELDQCIKDNAQEIRKLPEDWRSHIREEVRTLKEKFKNEG